MNTKNYTVTGPSGVNLRTLPSSTEGKVSRTAKKGETLKVVTDWSATNTAGGSSTKYLPVSDSGGVLWASASLVAPSKTYLQRSAEAAPYVYEAIYNAGCLHKGGAHSLKEIIAQKITTCSSAASAVLQEAGCLEVGKTVSHTAADGKGGKSKTTIEKTVGGWKNLRHCSVVHAGCTYAQLPDRLKKAGVVYVQDSNICVSAGSNLIYSCNKTGKRYGKNGEAVLRTAGYPFTSPVIYAIVPEG